MIVKMNIKELAEQIGSFDDVLIVAHINPDPDTLGSALGLKRIFENLGKNAYVACGTEASDRICGYFGISPELDAKKIEHFGFVPEYIVCVDAAAPSQLGSYEKYHSTEPEKNKIDLVIDHHYTNALYGKKTYLDTAAAATGEIIFELSKELGQPFDREFAKDLYCAIICDSGSFRYGSTTPKTLRAAAELMETGFDFAALNRQIFQNKSHTQLAIERLAYNSLKFYHEGKIAVITITNEAKKAAGLEGVEIEDINEIAKSVEGVEVGVVIKQVGPGEFRISLRSNEYVNVAQIAAIYGGGGHARAAGAKAICCCAKELETELVENLYEQI